jgi:hypothetical protein
LSARVGPDGILNLNVPVGISDANREVKIIVEPADMVGEATEVTQEQWARFVAETTGAWLGELERPEPGEFEVRDQVP